MAWVLCLALLMPTLPAAAADTRYSDTAGHWAEAEINRWSDYGVLQGSNGEFAPDAAITRAETAAIYSRIMGYTETAPNNFTDLGEDWYTNDILKAHAAGIIEGDGSTVRPLDNITRQEAAVVLCRALGIELEENVTQTSFADDA